MPLPGETFFPAPHRFPWRDGNHVELLQDGTAFFPRMEQAVENARQYVLLELYLFESGRLAKTVVDLLCRAARRQIAVYVLLDGFGSQGLSRADRRRLRESGVELHFYNPLRLRDPLRNLARDHRKMLVIDGETVFVGGAGVSDAFLEPDHPERSWRELVLQVRGPVVQDWISLFSEVWLQCAGTALPVQAPAMTPDLSASPARVTITRRMHRQEIRNSVLREIRRARNRIWLTTAYFAPSWTIRRALRRAALHGCDVRLLLPGEISDHPSVTLAGRRHYTRLLRAGVRIFEYQPRFLHMKLTLVDNWLSTGSCNLDHWTLRWNLEANLEIRDASVAAQVAAMLSQDLQSAHQIHIEDWESRSRMTRILERFFGWLDRLLSRIGN